MARSRQVLAPGTACRAPTAKIAPLRLRCGCHKYATKEKAPEREHRGFLISKRILVRSSGFEPPRYCYRQPLKLVRLPVPPRPRTRYSASPIIGAFHFRVNIRLATIQLATHPARNPSGWHWPSQPGVRARPPQSRPGSATCRAPTADSSSSEVSHCPKPCLWDNGTARNGHLRGGSK